MGERRFTAGCQAVQEILRFVNVQAALSFFFAGVYLKEDVKGFALRCVGAVAGEGCTDLLQLFNSLDACDGMDAVSNDGRLLELVTLYRTDDMATDAFPVERRAGCRKLEFRLLDTVFAEVGSAQADGVFYGLCEDCAKADGGATCR